MPASQTDRIGGLTTSVAVKAPVRVATTAAITLSGIQTIDGVLLQAGNGMDILADRVLVKNQADAVENGIYKVSARAWTREADFNGAFDAVTGTLVYVLEGVTWGDSYFRVTTPNPVQFGISEITFEPALGNLQLPEHLSDPVDIYLVDDGEYRETRTTDAGPRIQAIINSYPNNSTTTLNIYFPSGVTYMSDVTTGARTIAFIGKGLPYTNIIPTTITVGTLLIDGPFCKIIGLQIDDETNSYLVPGFVPNPADTRAGIVIGRGGNTAARNCLMFDVGLRRNRAQGVRWEGGSFLVMDRVTFGECASGGFRLADMSGDCNHFKFRNTSFTRCFNYGMYLQNTTNNGGAGWFEAIKFFENQNHGLLLEGGANHGSIFVEGSNGSGEGVTATRTIGSNVLSVDSVIRLVCVKVGSALDNGSTGFTNGTYVTAIDYANKTFTVSTNASSSGTSNYRIFTHTGNRAFAVRATSRAQGNVLHIMGDNLDPGTVADESAGTRNQLIIVDRNGNTITREVGARRVRVVQSDVMSSNPDESLNMSAFGNFTSGSADFTLTDPNLLVYIRRNNNLSATVTSQGGAAFAGNATITAINQTTGVITLSLNAIATGEFLVNFTVNMRGGLGCTMFDDNMIMRNLEGSNLSQFVIEAGRGGRFVGRTTAGSNQMVMKRLDENTTENVANNLGLFCYDNRVVPDGTTISSFTGPDANGFYTVTMSQNALLDATGVTFFMHNSGTGVNPLTRRVWIYPGIRSNNNVALTNNLRLNEIYITPTGEVRCVVPSASGLVTTFVWDPASIASGASETSPDITITGAATGDYVLAASTRDLQGMQLSGYVSAADTVKLTLYNLTGGAINMLSTTFNIQVKKA